MPGRSAPRRLRPAPVQAGTRYRVRITVPRLGSRRAWEATRSDFEQRLATAEIESETRRGRDYVRVTIAAAVYAADVARRSRPRGKPSAGPPETMPLDGTWLLPRLRSGLRRS